MQYSTFKRSPLHTACGVYFTTKLNVGVMQWMSGSTLLLQGRHVPYARIHARRAQLLSIVWALKITFVQGHTPAHIKAGFTISTVIRGALLYQIRSFFEHWQHKIDIKDISRVKMSQIGGTMSKFYGETDNQQTTDNRQQTTNRQPTCTLVLYSPKPRNIFSEKKQT